MGFTEEIAKLSEKVRSRAEQVIGEEATKMALIVPFLSSLGYDVYDPSEVKPEYIADFAIKKSGQFEKVDYAIAINGVIVMLVEAKARGHKAEAHDGQLSRYFNGLITTKVAIVTNGIEYRFFTDLRDKNVMDKEPFFTFNILEYDDKDIENLKLFHRDNFDVASINQYAEEMVYVKGMTHLVGHLLRSPSDEFIRFLVSELGKFAPGYQMQSKVTSKVIEKFKPIVKKSIQSSLVDLMTRSLSQEIIEISEVTNTEKLENAETTELNKTETSEESKIITTEEELQAFDKIRSVVTTSKNYHNDIYYKDTESYFSINLGKTNWWFLRFYLSSTKKTFIARISPEEARLLVPEFPIQEVPFSTSEAASKITISCLDDLDKLSSLILRSYELEASKHSSLQKV
jgi:predicted type IV restriction endonuclease